MECIFVNTIINNSTSYDKCKNRNNDCFYFDNKIEKNKSIKKELEQLVKDGKCEYVIYIVYENNSFISNNDFEVVEILIYKLLIVDNYIKRAYVYETKNKHYIQHLLSINRIAIDNKEPTDYYDFIYNSELINRFLNLINIFTHNNVIREYYGNSSEPVSVFDDVYKICFSNAYKRLQDKAQVFTSAKGDHYRNRLIHTNEVVTISLILLDKINKIMRETSKDSISIEVVTAIAMGHDIGHTPFGHQGERTLNDIIKSEEIDIIKNSGKILYEDMGGFKHNIQSIRVLTMNYDEDMNYNDSHIKSEILEGILKHTKYNINDVEKLIDEKYLTDLNISHSNDAYKNHFSLSGDSYQNREILHDPDTKVPLYMFKDFKNIYSNSYLSGEIVAFADEIAQRCSDIEDAVRSGLVDFEKLIKCLKEMEYNELIYRIDLRNYNDKVNIKFLCENIVNYYTDELTNSLKECDYKHIYFERRLFNFNKIISEYIQNKLIASNEISKFDSMGEHIVSKIFKSYYYNPRLLNIKVIKRIFNEMIKH